MMHDAEAIDALTTKVNELALVCARLSRENAELRSQVAAVPARALTASGQATAVTAVASDALAAGGDFGWPAEPACATRISRRAAVGVALAGAAAGIVGVTALTERDARTPAPGSTGSTGSTGTAELADAEQAALAAAPPTATGSVINATLSTASAVLAGTNTNAGPGVAGANTSTGAGVAGSNSGAGTGVSAVNSGTGPGVHATSGRGRGGIFGGAAAQIQLTPGAASHPRSGQRGDLYADASGRLWFCKTTGLTATWHQIA